MTEASRKSAWSQKEQRQYEHIKESEEERGSPRSKEIAARTVNKTRKKKGKTRKMNASSSSRSSRSSSSSRKSKAPTRSKKSRTSKKKTRGSASSRKKQTSKAKRGGLADRNVLDLRDRARRLKIRNYSHMRKVQLVREIEKRQRTG